MWFVGLNFLRRRCRAIWSVSFYIFRILSIVPRSLGFRWICDSVSTSCHTRGIVLIKTRISRPQGADSFTLVFFTVFLNNSAKSSDQRPGSGTARSRTYPWNQSKYCLAIRYRARMKQCVVECGITVKSTTSWSVWILYRTTLAPTQRVRQVK